jgi:hypothetical protein
MDRAQSHLLSEAVMQESQIVILDPVAKPTVKLLSLNARPTDIVGLRLAVVDNTKPNFNVFMDRVQEILLSHYHVASVERFVKPGRTVGVATSVVAEIKARTDFAITGLGD